MNLIDPYGLKIPGWLRKKVYHAVDLATNKAFTRNEIDSILDVGEPKANMGRIWAFKKIKVLTFKGQEYGVLLSNKQNKIIDEVLNQLVKENPKNDLLKKALEEYKKALVIDVEFEIDNKKYKDKKLKVECP